MSTSLSRLLTILLVAVLAVATFDAAAARNRKPAKKEAPSIVRDLDGTPIIMRGYRAPRMRNNNAGDVIENATQPGRTLPPVNPSPNSPNSPPAAALIKPAPAPHRPPSITTYGDRVTNCIHSFPLNAGIGNNPTNQQSYVRQCAN
ncbi:MAG: hypothetical protein J0H89_15055 [Rhizobiales bacterium]|nr:hypothetical protein [Hyphomicrobiales bacterium]